MKGARRFGAAALFAAAVAALAVPASAGTSVNINIGPPAVVMAAPPEMVVVPNTRVYFAPDVEADLFFYRDGWYTRSQDRWYKGRSHDGPWVLVGPRAVPAEIVRVPRNYRTVYVREEHVPYGQLKKHAKHREYKEHKRGRGHRHDRDDD